MHVQSEPLPNPAVGIDDRGNPVVGGTDERHPLFDGTDAGLMEMLPGPVVLPNQPSLVTLINDARPLPPCTISRGKIAS